MKTLKASLAAVLTAGALTVFTSAPASAQTVATDNGQVIADNGVVSVMSGERMVMAGNGMVCKMNGGQMTMVGGGTVSETNGSAMMPVAECPMMGSMPATAPVPPP